MYKVTRIVLSLKEEKMKGESEFRMYNCACRSRQLLHCYYDVGFTVFENIGSLTRLYVKL